MDLKFSDSDITFRQEVIDFLAAEYPSDIKEKQDKRIPLDKDEIVRWQKILNEKGWFTINWPVQYSGQEELSVTQKYILQEELAKANTPTTIPFGVGMCAPVLYSFGTEEQKQKFLPSIQNSDVWWCQGYSEPGSGSDLASLKTKAELKDNKYIVNGTKTWTTLAQHADWIFCLVRTETTDIKQEGISFLLIDMKTPGIEVKPIITIDGSSGRIILGSVPTVKPEISGDFSKLMSWADNVRKLRVRTNAETPLDTKVARDFGAEGIGLCRTEHMFFDEERIISVREMILSKTKDDRLKALLKLLPHQKKDFVEIFKIMH